MEKKRHSDDLDFLAKLDYNKGAVIIGLVLFSIGLIYGLEYTGSTVIESDREIALDEIKTVLSGTPYQVYG